MYKSSQILRRLAASAVVVAGMSALTSGTAAAQSCPSVNVPGATVTVGTTYQVDRVGNRDKCVVINTGITANPVCPQGRELRRRTGRDQCRQIVRATSCPGVSGVPGISGTVGTVLAIDRIGIGDRCVVPNTAVMVLPACPIGLSRTTRNGRDDCRG